MKSKQVFVGLLAIGAMLDSTRLLSDSPRLAKLKRAQSQGSRNGHTTWGRYHDAKTKKSRAKERRAKLARKTNWN